MWAHYALLLLLPVAWLLDRRQWWAASSRSSTSGCCCRSCRTRTYAAAFHATLVGRDRRRLRERTASEPPCGTGARRRREPALMQLRRLGGGVLGLTAALRLAQRGHEVTVLERATVPGGLAGSFEVAPGIWLEKFYHHLFRTDRRAIALIEELGLGRRLAVAPAGDDGASSAAGSEPLDSPTPSCGSRRCPVRDRAAARRGRRAAAGACRRPGSLENVRPRGRWMREVMGGRPSGPSGSRCCAASSATPPTTSRWPGCGRGSTAGRASSAISDGGFHQLYAALAGAVVERGGTIVYGARRRRSSRGGVDVVVSRTPPAATLRVRPRHLDAARRR